MKCYIDYEKRDYTNKCLKKRDKKLVFITTISMLLVVVNIEVYLVINNFEHTL